MEDTNDNPNIITSKWHRSTETACQEVARAIRGREAFFGSIAIESITLPARLGAYPVALYRAVARRNLALLRGDDAMVFQGDLD